MLEVGTTTQVELTANQVIPFTTVLYDTNDDSHFDSTSNALTIDKSGYYTAKGIFTFAPTEAGDASVYLYINGSSSPTVTATFTTSAENQKVSFVIPSKVIRTIPTFADTSVPVTFVVSPAGTLYNANASLFRER